MRLVPDLVLTDAGYAEAIAAARRHRLDLPGITA